MLEVQSKQCKTCIYKPNLGWDVKQLEAQIADPFMEGFFNGHRDCHHATKVVCRGFWNRHKNNFSLGQVAQRMNMVKFVEVDNGSF